MSFVTRGKTKSWTEDSFFGRMLRSRPSQKREEIVAVNGQLIILNARLCAMR